MKKLGIMLGLGLAAFPVGAAPAAPAALAVVNFGSSPVKKTGAPTPVTVMPFTPLAGGEPAWLSKGLADLLIRHLSEVPALAVLERERMQAFTAEVGLGETGLVDRDKALRLGRVAKVKEVIYGNYTLHNGRISLSLFLLDLDSQEVLQEEKIEGPLGDVRNVTRELALRFLKNRGVTLTDAQRARVRFQATDSFDATEHFYRGLDLSDRGRHAEAFGEFAAAAEKDPRYGDAALGMGRMLEALGHYRQSVVTYEKLARESQDTEGLDALYLAGRVKEQRLKDPAAALADYQALGRAAPVSPHALEASFRRGALLEQQGRWREAYWAYSRVDRFRERLAQEPGWDYRSSLRASSVLGWEHAIRLYRDAIVKMVSLYPQAVETSPAGRAPPPPRGLLFLNDPHTAFTETTFDHTRPLFFADGEPAHFRERLYAVALPAGRVATGAELSVTGRVLDAQPYHSYDLRLLPFPLPPDAINKWIGAVFGQTTSVETQHRIIPFYGRRLRLFAVALLESNAEITGWSVRVDLRPGEPVAPPPDPPAEKEFWEGKPLGAVPLPAAAPAADSRPHYEIMNRPKRELALARLRTGYHLVNVGGHLDGDSTDLWISHSPDGAAWSPLELLPVNSPAEDYDPRLVPAEDGRLALAWLSNRRGKGWELWMSLSPDGRRWSDARRVPLEQAAPTGAEKIAGRPPTLLHYDLFQDSRGRWIVAFISRDTGELAFLTSTDAETWTPLATTPAPTGLNGLSLTQDSSGLYRLAALGDNGRLFLYSSATGASWDKRAYPLRFWTNVFVPDAAVQRLALFSTGLGGLLLLASNNTYGLQFSAFHPDQLPPRLGLVARAGLDPYAAAPLGKGYLVAFKNGDTVSFHRYEGFTIGERAPQDTPNWPIYVESERDAQGNTWRRITAEARDRVPDVNALAVQPNGRVWWGMETGVMSVAGWNFFATDVSQGFFHHDLTGIAACRDGGVWFWSRNLNAPRVGRLAPGFRFDAVSLAGAHGAVRSMACGPEGAYAGTGGGNIVALEGGMNAALRPPAPVTALAAEANALWAGTADGRLLRITAGRTETVALPPPGAPITALAWDTDGRLWVARPGGGLLYREGQRWVTLPHCPYASVGVLRADGRKGVWYLPADDEFNQGLGYTDGRVHRLYNPPHRRLPPSVAVDIDGRGHAWIGTAYDGVFELIPHP